jgi:hypothetical protein
VGISLALLIATFAALFSLSGLHDARSRLLLIACALASAPLQIGMESGQPALPAATLVILAVWAFSKDRLALAGILLGTATIIKLQIGAPFILYYLFIRQWRIGALASILFAVATMAAIARMQAFGINTWCADWHRNIAITLETGQINDPLPGGPWRNDMVNLQTLIDVVVRRQMEIDLCVLLLVLPLLVGFTARVRPTRMAGTDLLALSLVAAISMLPLYRRLYDGILLLMLLAWAIARLHTPNRRKMAIAALVMLGEFLLPIDLVQSVLRRTHWFDSMTSSVWWQGLIVPHHAWGMLILTAGTLCIFTRIRKPLAILVPSEPADDTRIPAAPQSA